MILIESSWHYNLWTQLDIVNLTKGKVVMALVQQKVYDGLPHVSQDLGVSLPAVVEEIKLQEKPEKLTQKHFRVETILHDPTSESTKSQEKLAFL